MFRNYGEFLQAKKRSDEARAKDERAIQRLSQFFQDFVEISEDGSIAVSTEALDHPELAELRGYIWRLPLTIGAKAIEEQIAPMDTVVELSNWVIENTPAPGRP